MKDFPIAQMANKSACNAGDLGSIPGSGKTSGEGNGNPLQYSCLETLMDRGDWQATVGGVEKSRIQLNDQHFYYYFNSSYQNLHFSSFLVHEKMEA